MKPRAVIFDIDGTIADCEHRRHFLAEDPQDWRSFYESMVTDTPKLMVLGLCEVLAHNGAHILYTTGRPETYRDHTMEWMAYNGVPPGILLMRAENDHRNDAVVKEEIYRTKIEPTYDVKLVIDDRNSVVEMWRRLGLECWQVAAGDF